MGSGIMNLFFVKDPSSIVGKMPPVVPDWFAKQHPQNEPKVLT